MKSKNIFGFFLAIAIVLLLATSVSAGEIADNTNELIKVNKIDVTNSPGILAGDVISIDVYFSSLQNASDVRIKAEIEGTKVDIDTEVFIGDVELGQRYGKTLTLQVPYELKDEVSGDLDLNIKIWNGDHKTEFSYPLRVQRPSYNVGIMSISTSQEVEAGELVPVDVALKNIGYNYLDDLYLSVEIPALNLEKSVYVGDLVELEVEDDDEEDTVRARLYLRIPYDAKAGIYTVEVEVYNDDLSITETSQISVKNDFSSNVVATELRKTFSTGDKGAYNLLIVNPTNKVKVYRVVPESTVGLSVTASESVVAVPTGSSKTVKIYAEASERGEHQFSVNVFSGDELVGSVTLSANIEGAGAESAVVVLTIILAIIFVILLIVLIVLLRKKPEKTEEFGESYY